jgi:hypothetical protein
MRRFALLSSAALIAAAVACGSSDSSSVTGTNNNGNNSTSPMTATVDGKAWSGTGTGVSYKNNLLNFTAVDLASTTAITVASNVTGSGTYSLAFANPNAGLAILTTSGSHGKIDMTF